MTLKDLQLEIAKILIATSTKHRSFLTGNFTALPRENSLTTQAMSLASAFTKVFFRNYRFFLRTSYRPSWPWKGTCFSKPLKWLVFSSLLEMIAPR